MCRARIRSTTKHLAVLLVLVLAPGCVENRESRKLRAADGAALRWLAIVDAGRYSEAWHEGAPPFKTRASVQEWTKDVSSRPLDAVTERRRVSQQYLTAFGGSQGEFFNLVYTVSTAGGGSYGELLTVTMAPDGQWRVYGYRAVGVKRHRAAADVSVKRISQQ